MHYTICKPDFDPEFGETLSGTDIYIPPHSLGDGWTRHIVQLEKGDTADNPASTKGPVYGPGFLVYDVAASGISAKLYENAGDFYDDIFETRLRRAFSALPDGTAPTLENLSVKP